MRLISNLACNLALVCLLALVSLAQTQPAADADFHSIYQQLRNLSLGSETVSVSNFDLKRDAATFHLTSGTVCFAAPVNGKITGAVFVGDGTVVLDPPLASERSNLRLLTKEDEFSESFNHLVLRFTDFTYDEIKRAGSQASADCDAGLLRDSQNAMRHDRMLKYNLEARIFEDLLSPAPGGLFVAFIHGKKYNGKEIYAIDPHGAPPLIAAIAPEEVELLTYDEGKLGVWAAFHLSEEYKNGTASGAQKNSVIHIEHQTLDTTIEKNANLIGKATTKFAAQTNGLRVVPFDLFPTLRVQSVTGEGGEKLSFIQEDKKEDADFLVVLPRVLSLGEKYTITTSYEGKEAVSNEGNGNYFPIARENWYPNNPNFSLGEYSDYDMTFRVPKGMKMAATGGLVSESHDGNQGVTVWKSEAPQTVAGFSFGRFRKEEAKLEKPAYLVQSYANEDPPDWVQALAQAAQGNPLQQDGSGLHVQPEVALGNLNTTGLEKKALATGELSVQLYSDYFGPSAFNSLALTQQTVCSFGQSWPGLVWIPLCYFFDDTVRHQLGMDWGSRGYWKVVTPHEIAHQWWGHTVGFNSYRDQWMSEGFSDMSASLFIQSIEKDPKKFIEFWDDERYALTRRDPEGFRAIDAGPLTMGYRMNNTRTGLSLTRDLIYPKGAYVLHMIRMMMFDRQTGDKNFKEMMHDFVATYRGRAATTEDFKAIVEKHLTPEMQRVGGGKMDWFFDEYVFGTALPSYAIDSHFDKNADGDVVLTFKITQANVNGSFRMLVPMYMELADGRVVSLGRATIIGNSSIDGKIPMKGIKDIPHRAMLNYFDDVLASPD